MKDLEARKEASKFVTWADGGEDRPVVAFIRPNGAFGGSSTPERYKSDDRIKKGYRYKITTNGKYTRWKYGLINTNEL
jgi:hypothetical protein